eukprot:764143-Hanusia_phi.AAC.2
MLGLYILCTRDCRYADSSSKLFPGSDQRQRFATDLRRAVVFAAEKEANDSVNHAAMNVEQTGTHSIRKGSVRDLLGLVDGPGTAGIYLRASWSLGETQDRYVTAGAGADQHCGRVLAGLDGSSVDFALLPTPPPTSAGKVCARWGRLVGISFFSHSVTTPWGLESVYRSSWLPSCGISPPYRNGSP